MRNGGIMLRGGLKQKVKDVKVAEANTVLEKSIQIDRLKNRSSRALMLSPRDLDKSDISGLGLDSARPLMTPSNANKMNLTQRKEAELREKMKAPGGQKKKFNHTLTPSKQTSAIKI